MTLCKCGCGQPITSAYKRNGFLGFLRGHNPGESYTHGMTRTPIYRRWQAMKARCGNPNNSEYRNYGGRGISVCSRWGVFEDFVADMGRSFSENLELDRIDTNGNYEPSNCRWVSRTAQQRNKRNNHSLEINGEKKTLVEWGEETGLKANTILTRIRRGWPHDRLLEIANQEGR